jgi:hypothetical protein
MTSGSGPIPSLSVGNAVSTGFQLYRTHAKEYLKISLTAIFWSLLPVLAIIGIGLAIAGTLSATQEPTSLIGVVVFALIAVFVFWFYCYAKCLTNMALISRLAFGELNSQPESLKDAQRFVNSRKWSFLLASFYVGLIVAGLLLALFLIFGIITAVMVFASGGFGSAAGSSGNPLIAFISGLLLVVLVLAAIVFFSWLGARLSAVEVPLAVETQSSASKTVSRIWQLTKGHTWQVFLILLVTFCVTVPVYLVAQTVSIVPRVLITLLIPSDSDTQVTLQVLSALVSYATSLLLSILVLPLWQSIKAVVYYDLRNRHEGFGLKLRDRGEPGV